MRNQINISRSIGLIFLGFGVVASSLTFSETYQILSVNSFFDAYFWEEGLPFMVITSLSFLITGLLGLFRSPRFQIAGRVSLAFAMLVFTFIYFSFIFPKASNRDYLIIYALGITTYGLLISFFVMFGSEAFSKALRIEQKNHRLNEDILDQEDF